MGEIAVIMRGGNFQKKDFVESGLPCIHYGQMYTHFGTWADKTLTFVSKDVFEKSRQAYPSDIIMAVTSENVEDVCKCTAWVGSEPVAVSGHTAIIRHNQNAKYLSYFFQSAEFYRQKVKLAHGTKVIEVTPDKLNGIEIPLPPLDVQERLVRVLDNFDSICSDLKIGLPAEIEARKKQYEFYRDSLLTFAESGRIAADNVGGGYRYGLIRIVQYVFGYAPVRLGEIGKVCMCKRILKNQTSTTGDIPFYKIGTFGKIADAFISRTLFEEYKAQFSFPKKGDILISAAGTIGRTVIYDGEPAYYQDSNIVWIDNDETIALNKWLFYCYQMSPWHISTGGTIARLYNDNISNAEIPLPPLDVQERLVRVLDNFDSICSDLNIGLPAEIEARRKQYEYYRDKLLTFSVVSTGSTTV